MAVTSYAIGLGSNRPHGRYGYPRAVLAAALDDLEARGLRVLRRSNAIETAPVGLAGRRFANAAAIVATDLSPPALLALLKEVERDFGRKPGRRWSSRVLDLDILLWSGGQWRSRRLIVPHPALATRAFVLRPLRAIVPDWQLPRRALAVKHLAARLRQHD